MNKDSLIDEFESTPEGKAALNAARREIQSDLIITERIADYLEDTFDHHGETTVEHAAHLYEIARGSVSDEEIAAFQPPRRQR